MSNFNGVIANLRPRFNTFIILSVSFKCDSLNTTDIGCLFSFSFAFLYWFWGSHTRFVEIFTYSDSLTGSSLLPSVVGASAAVSVAPASAVGVFPAPAASSPPWGSGPWWGVAENPSPSFGYLVEADYFEVLLHVVQVCVVSHACTSQTLHLFLSDNIHSGSCYT